MPEHRRDQPVPPQHPTLPPPISGPHDARTWAQGGPVHYEPGTEGFAQFAPSQSPNVFLGRSASSPRKRKVRVFTWVIVAVNVLFLLATIAAASAGGGAAEQTCAGQSFDEVFTKQDCLDAANAGAAIGSGFLMFAILVVWALVDVILGVLWMVTRKRDA